MKAKHRSRDVKLAKSCLPCFSVWKEMELEKIFANFSFLTFVHSSNLIITCCGVVRCGEDEMMIRIESVEK